MGLFGFPFKSRAQLEKERRQYARRLLPLGDGQRDRALAILRVAMSSRLVDDERVFAFLHAKQAYLDALADEDMADSFSAAIESMEHLTWLTDHDKKAVVALVSLEHGIESLDAYPSVEDVQSFLSA